MTWIDHALIETQAPFSAKVLDCWTFFIKIKKYSSLKDFHLWFVLCRWMKITGKSVWAKFLDLNSTCYTCDVSCQNQAEVSIFWNWDDHTNLKTITRAFKWSLVDADMTVIGWTMAVWWQSATKDNCRMDVEILHHKYDVM